MSRWAAADLAPVVDEALRCLRDDNGRLWSVDVEPRWIIVDDDVWWLTEPDGEATPAGPLWTYAADPLTATANTAVHRHNRAWAMIDSGDELPTARLLLHEAFHAFTQPVVFDWVTPFDGGDNSLNEAAPCAALVTELRVWADALERGDHQLAAAARSIRQWRIDQLADDERGRQDHLELWEGLAEYSACRWSGVQPPEIADLARHRPDLGSWHRSFCYTTGPVLGYVLDLVDDGWRPAVRSAGSVGTLINNVIRPSPEPIDQLLDRFGYQELLRTAEAAHEAWTAEDRKLRDSFATALWIPNRTGVTFDPHGGRRWEIGSYYRSVAMRTPTMRLDAEAAVVTANWRWIGLPLPSPEAYDPGASVAEGPGWRITSATGRLADLGVRIGPEPPVGTTLPES